jgi:hypothetical protein
MHVSFGSLAGALLLLAVTVPTSAFAQYPTQPPSDGSLSSADWQRLQEKGTGRSAIVTLRDGTLRGGRIDGVTANALRLQTAGETLEMNPSSIAVVRVKRPSRTWIGTVVGYMAAAVACALIADADDDLSTRDLIVVGGVGGIPGALIGGYIGHRSGGDFEIVP